MYFNAVVVFVDVVVFERFGVGEQLDMATSAATEAVRMEL